MPTHVLEESVDAPVPATFAWSYRTDVGTWHDPPAAFFLDGPFANGSQGRTVIPGQPPVRWWIRDVEAGRSFAIEFPLDRATLRCEWHFVAVTESATRLTQRIFLDGNNAAAYYDHVKSEFGRTLADGMKKVAADMVAAFLRIQDAQGAS